MEQRAEPRVPGQMLQLELTSSPESSSTQQSTKKSVLIQAKCCGAKQHNNPPQKHFTAERWGSRAKPQAKGHTQCNNPPKNHFHPAPNTLPGCCHGCCWAQIDLSLSLLKEQTTKWNDLFSSLPRGRMTMLIDLPHPIPLLMHCPVFATVVFDPAKRVENTVNLFAIPFPIHHPVFVMVVVKPTKRADNDVDRFGLPLPIHCPIFVNVIFEPTKRTDSKGNQFVVKGGATKPFCITLLHWIGLGL